MKYKIRTLLASFAVALHLLLFTSSAIAQNTVEASGLCITGTITLSEFDILDGKIWYMGFGTVLGFADVEVSLYWSAVDSRWFLAFDGQPYFEHADDTALPPSTSSGGWVATVDNLDCGEDTGEPLSVTGTGTEGGGDADGDGTPDAEDGCPNDPDKIAAGLCGCGVADTDTDGDGTPNCNDGCPNDPDKIAAGVCGCGVADTDTDGDGTPNCNDGCPNDPDKIAAGVCGCGVADTDTDGDGTADCIDNCPGTNTSNQTDSDCDGVGDACDVCPGGDDSVDNDHNGLPDCKYPPAFGQIISAWKCGDHKVYVCHKPDGPHHTLCVDYSSLTAHLGHGDYLGPCDNAGCNGRAVAQNSLIGLDSGKDSGHHHEGFGLPELRISPNPAFDQLTIDLQDFEGEGLALSLYNSLGAMLWSQQLKNAPAFVNLNLQTLGLPMGVYTIGLRSGTGVYAKQLVLTRN